jgi:hypothetical protein
MSPSTRRILAARLRNQRLDTSSRSAAAVVTQLGAVQAQDYIGAKWALGLRASGLDAPAVEAVFNRGDILRTHVLRPTWHFVTPADIRWMLTLTAPRIRRATGSYYRQLALDAKTMSRVYRVLEIELGGGRFRTRAELATALAKRGIAVRGGRMSLMPILAELEQVICSGPVRGRQLTYALFDERAPAATAKIPRDPEGELASRYFASHGPATVRDFVWWSGLTVAQAKRGIDSAPLSAREVEGFRYFAATWDAPGRMPPATFLLPNYDEYLIAYKDRHLVRPAAAVDPEGIMGGVDAYAHPLVVDGLLAGVWRRRVSGAKSRVEVVPKIELSTKQRRAVSAAATRLVSFSGPGLTLV